MIVVASAYGQTLVFTNREDLDMVLKQLSGMLEWGDSDDSPGYPMIYHQAEEHVPRDEIDRWTEWIKYVMGING